MTKTVAVCSLAIRTEGNMWNAYITPLDGMEGAVLIGSIHMAHVDNRDSKNALRQEAFKQLMRQCMYDFVERSTGERPVGTAEMPAPTTEQVGHG